ncbi:type II toxin-antitoxin system CcdA family antitoxin [Thermococcus sp. GR7]|uniref:type II toxin-antitoxin system CcdA family antitoxin n=2 Tax=Thermococcus TaxID=2263 RepID=UPI0014302369|nr:type II toxin-antitoxin system CcdA family antitoxin [Thermococcus sp. GR7]
MGEKVRTTVLISRELHQKAKDKGINLSRLLEKALMIELELLESLDLKREEFLRQGLLEDKVKSGDEKLGGGMMSLEPPDW